MKPGTDHAVYDSNGKRIATLLASWYPTRLDLERAKKAYERGTGGKVTVEARGERA